MSTPFTAWTPNIPLGAGIVLLQSDGKVYDFTTGSWDALPSNGVPLAANVLVMGRATATGPLAGNWFCQPPNFVSQTGNVAVCVVMLDASGNVISQLDSFPMQWLIYGYGVGGGFMK